MEGRRGLGANYRRFWLSQGAAGFGDAICAVALPLLAITELRADPFEVSVLIALETVPWLVLGLPTGVWVERWRKRSVLALTAVVRLAAMTAIPLLWLGGLLTFWSLFGAVLLAGVAGVFSQTAAMAIVPELVERADLVAANSRLAAAGTSVSVAGESLGGVMVTAIGAAFAFILDAVTSLVSAVLLARITARPHPSGAQRRSFGRELREGVRLTVHDRALMSLAVVAALQNFLVAARYALIPGFLVTTLGTTTWLVGLLVACESIGGLVGALLARRLSRQWGSGGLWRHSLLIAAVVGLGIPFAFPGVGLVVFALCACAATACATIAAIMTSAARQAMCPPQLLSRLSATTRTLTWGVIPLGAMAGGALGVLLGIGQALWVVAAGFALPWLIAVLGPLRRERDLHELPAGGPRGGAAAAGTP